MLLYQHSLRLSFQALLCPQGWPPLIPTEIALRDSQITLAISAQSEVAPLNTLVPSEPVPSAPEPKIELDTVIQEIIIHCKTADIENNPVEILRHAESSSAWKGS